MEDNRTPDYNSYNRPPSESSASGLNDIPRLRPVECNALELNNIPPSVEPSTSGLNDRPSSISADTAISYDRPPSVPPPPPVEVPVYSPDDEPPAYEPPPLDLSPSSGDPKPECASSSAVAASQDLSEIELPPTPTITTNPVTNLRKKRTKSSLKSLLIFNVILIFLGPIFLCSLPCWLSVIVAYCVAHREYRTGDYVETDCTLNAGGYCFAIWILTSIIGGLGFLVSLPYII